MVRAASIGLALSVAGIAHAQLPAERIEEKRQLLAAECPDLASGISVVLSDHVVIDTHAHTFNLGHLPIEGLLYRSRFPAALAKPLADIFERLVDESDLEDTDDAGRPARVAGESDEKLTPEEQATLLRERRKIYKAIRRGGQAPGRLPTAEQPRRAPARASEGDEVAAQQILLDVSRALARDGHGAAEVVGKEESLRGWLEFLGVPLKREDHVAWALRNDHLLVDVFVHHMMDMESVYDDRATFDLETQLERMARLDEINKGATRLTVAFDPFRGPGALDQVRNGIRNGAIGIKFYPPSGYRPSKNEIPPKPSYFQKQLPFVYLPLTARRAQRRQWRARYRNGHTETPEQLDNVVMSMFKLARSEDIPVFSHHTPVGFEASKAYAKRMAMPCLWREVIEALGPEAEAKTFRLVLGHAGGGDAWLGKEGHPWQGSPEQEVGSFDQQAYNLCVYYPNVYCDFGYFPEILTDEGRAAFADRLHQLIEEREQHPERIAETWNEDACKTKRNAPPRFKIEDKILFGTDWYMVTREKNQEQLVCGFARAFSSDVLSPEQGREIAAGFFGKNALNAFPRLR